MGAFSMTEGEGEARPGVKGPGVPMMEGVVGVCVDACAAVKAGGGRST